MKIVNGKLVLVLAMTVAVMLAVPTSGSVLAMSHDDVGDSNSHASKQMTDTTTNNNNNPSTDNNYPPTDPQAVQTPPPTTPSNPSPDTKPTPVLKGNNIQSCTGIESIFQCNQFVKNIHNTHTTVKGSNILIGTPVAAINGATPVVLYIPGVGYVELTGIQNAGNGQATFNYLVLVPSK